MVRQRLHWIDDARPRRSLRSRQHSATMDTMDLILAGRWRQRRRSRDITWWLRLWCRDNGSRHKSGVYHNHCHRQHGRGHRHRCRSCYRRKPAQKDIGLITAILAVRSMG